MLVPPLLPTRLEPSSVSAFRVLITLLLTSYVELGEIFPIDLKLDYKPRRVDYRALKEGRTIELMNFFHFDGAEMTLRHITLAGVCFWKLENSSSALLSYSDLSFGFRSLVGGNSSKC